MVGAIVLQIVLIFLNAVFASAEIAVISTNETKLHKMAEKGDRRAKRLTRLTSQPSKFLSTIQVAITLAGLLGSAFAADNFAQPLADALYRAGVPLSQAALKTICMILITFVLSYFNIVFGELIPKRVAMRRAEKMALGMSGMLRFVSILFAPLGVAAHRFGERHPPALRHQARRGRRAGDRGGDSAHGGGGQRERLDRGQRKRLYPQRV